MSRIGNKPIEVPSGVTIVREGNLIKVKGPKGELIQIIPAMIGTNQEGSVFTVTRPSESKLHKSMHGLTRTLIANMVIGVTEQFTKTLEVNGVGYRVAMKGKGIALTVGKSHPVELMPPEGITVATPDQNTINVTGCDKQAVGEFAANIRKERPAEPYKGKGIKYKGEVIKRKEGKTGSKK